MKSSFMAQLTRAIGAAIITTVHFVEAADGGHSAFLRLAALLDTVNRHDLHGLALVVVYMAYDWIRSGDNAARAIKTVRSLFENGLVGRVFKRARDFFHHKDR
jgi:hypothetical protein